MNTSRPASGYGRCLRITERTTVKMPVFAPMHNARVRIVVMANARSFQNSLTANRRSCRRVSTDASFRVSGIVHGARHCQDDESLSAVEETHAYVRDSLAPVRGTLTDT